MIGIIGKKVGMTSVFDESGKYIACTLVQTGENVVTEVRTPEQHGYSAIQVAFDEKKEKNTTKPMLNHFKKANTTPKRKLVEFRDPEGNFELGTVLNISEILKEGDIVSVVGTSKGKGFQGVVKRHGFSGVGEATHGQHNRLRHPGSIGSNTYPAHVWKGKRMAGRTGNKRVKIENLRILKVLPEQNLVVVSGAIPGAKNSYVIISK
ncbi:MAG: 50S ribosomal protein L3 [Flammeovirgaceae bacterium]|nr:50S ribosomal protein L3 [Flammeovirgaceae bacterium]MDW8288189.1 50S ribosomal protein L3 [Flammeovirgaceae bacterium]